MCGRLTLTTLDVDEVARALDAEVAPEDKPLYRPRYNAAPTDLHWALDGKLLVPARWGLSDGLINVRSERKSMPGKRVAIPADGFFEWSGKQPVWFRPRGLGLFVFAGVAEVLPDGRLGFAVLTQEAQGEVARIHDRMPVVLAPGNATRWLHDSVIDPVLDLVGREVSPLVNNVRNDRPEILGPPSQLTLL
jgi:putative SOS response-associated peptidase YedK